MYTIVLIIHIFGAPMGLTTDFVGEYKSYHYCQRIRTNMIEEIASRDTVQGSLIIRGACVKIKN